jgi:glycosyltransferase involved in cell wall biosynthesis
MMALTGVLLGSIKKIETTMYVLDLWPENLYSVLKIKNRLLRAFVLRVSNWHYRKTDKLIANSQKLREILIDRIGKEDSKVIYIPQFCDKGFEASVIDKELVNRFIDTFNMVYTGNISPAQSFETVISAAKILKSRGYDDIRWIIVGEGMSKAWLETEVVNENLSDIFEFIGRVPMEDIPKYTYIANGLFACLSKSELLDCTIPAKVLSYYAAGRPLVLAMDGEIQQIVEESGAGYIVDSEDSNGLADEVAKLYSATKEERKAMGESAKRYYFKHFERNMNMAKLIEFVES